MKREQIVKRIVEAAQAFNKNVNVFTCGAIYPKCYLAPVSENIGGYDRPGERLTPDMLPTHLLAYVQGMASVKV